MDWAVAQQLLVSLGLGMLVGLQRERVESSVGGIRTFPLITLLGTVCGQLAQVHGGWILGAGFIALGALLLLPNLPRVQAGDAPGLTTEIAVLLLFALGAFIVTGPMMLAVVLGGVVALLLHWKAALHHFVSHLGDTDMRAIMLFVLISMVILPVLPREDFGPYGVLNLFEIWLMVVLIVGLSLLGYVAYKLFGSRAGVMLSGVLGGVISSTATTVSSSRLVSGAGRGVRLAMLIIMIAAATAILRSVVMIAIAAPGSFAALAPPLATLFGAMFIVALCAWVFGRDKDARMPEQKNPAQLMAALFFAAVYALVKLAVAAAQDQFGASGLYVVAVLAGLTDLAAITLSTARLVETGGLEAGLGWRIIVVAAISNLAFKAGVVAVLGSSGLFARVAMLFAVSAAAGGAILWLWP
jgi:uncharacterized membrane protein (DUF4010 family)